MRFQDSQQLKPEKCFVQPYHGITLQRIMFFPTECEQTWITPAGLRKTFPAFCNDVLAIMGRQSSVEELRENIRYGRGHHI